MVVWQQRLFQVFLGLAFLRIFVAVWDGALEILFFPLQYIDQPLSMYNYLLENISITNSIQYDFLNLIYLDFALLITALYFFLALLRVDRPQLQNIRFGSMIYVLLIFLHSIRTNAERGYFEFFNEVNDYPGIYLMLLQIMMVVVFWSLKSSSDHMRKLRVYGGMLFAFKLVAGLIISPILILVDNFIPEEYLFSVLNTIYIFLYSLIITLLAIKTIQYGNQVIGWAQSDNHTELYAQAT